MAANLDFHSDHMSTTSCSSVTLNSAHSSVSDVSSVSFSCDPPGGSFNGGGYCSARSSISYEINSVSDYGSINKPHKANHAAWEAIRSLRSKDGSIGISHFKLLARLGSGDIGNVYLCQLRSDGTDSGRSCGGLYAMKVVDKAALAYRDKLQRAEMEKQILAMLDHPFLPTLYAHFDASHYSCLVMEFCPGGDLHSLRQRQHQRRFSLKAARFYAAEVVVALEYLHMMGIIYRDLKPENILVREDGHIMLSDFDLSLKCDAFLSLQNTYPTSSPSPSTCSNMSIEPVISCFYQSTAPQNSKTRPQNGRQEKNLLELVAEPNEARSKSFVGTHEYLAPEIISGQGHGSAVDWYTLGVFIYELIYGTTPFKGPNNEMTLLNILTQPLRFPDLKVSYSDVDGWNMATDIVKKLLVRDPRFRLGSSRGAADVKRHPFFKGINWALIRSITPPEVPAIHMRSLKKNTHTYQQQQLPPHFDCF